MSTNTKRSCVSNRREPWPLRGVNGELFNIPDHISRFRRWWQISPGSRPNMTRQILLIVLTRVEKSDRYGNETGAVGNRIVPAAAVTSSTCRSIGRGESHGRKGGGKMSLRHRSHSVNRNSPFRLRGRFYQPSRDRPVELDARRLARPVRRRLVGVILLPRFTLPWFGRNIARRVIPTFYPICLGWPVSATDWGRCGQTFDARHRRPTCFKAGEAHHNERNPVHGGPGSMTSFNLAGVGSFEPGDRPNRT